MNREEQVGDPSLLPRVHGKEVQYIKPLPKPEMRKPASRRKCVFGDDYNRILDPKKAKTDFTNISGASSSNEPPHPVRTSLDDSDLSVSEESEW